MIRQALMRAQSGLKKEVGTTKMSKVRLIVASLQEPQWEAYKASKAVHAPKFDLDTINKKNWF